MDVFNFLYLFDSREEAFKVLDGETGQEILKDWKNRELRPMEPLILVLEA